MENSTDFASVDAFNFDNMVTAVGADPFASKSNKYAKDERFYTLAKDKDGNGAAIIRFLPDSEKGMIQEMFKINTTVTKNGKKRFVSEYSPAVIGQPCPFQEEWQRLWDLDDKEGSRNFSRGKVYVANIKVINDPKAPENNGKIFLYQFSGAMNKKLEAAMRPSEDDKVLGVIAKQVFNPLAGNSMRLVAQKGSNGQINYDKTEIIPDVTNAYTVGDVVGTVEMAVNDIKNNTHKLSSLLAPEAFMTYEELQKKFAWVTWTDKETPVVEVAVPVVEVAVPVVEVAEPVTQTVDVTPVQTVPVQAVTPSLDDLLNQIS